MKHLRYTIIFILVAVLAAGCYKDLGNYDYSEINQVEITGFPVELQYAYSYVDTLRVSPTLTGSLAKEDMSHYFLKWQAVVKSGTAGNRTTFDLDSNRLELEYFVRLPEAEYTVYLLVEDMETGVTWRQGFDLKVTTATNEGWLILSDADGYCRLDMVSTSTKEEQMVRNLWEYSPLSYRKGPRKLAHWADMYAASGAHPVFLLTDEGAVKLDPDDFSYDYLNEVMYEFGKWDPDFVPTCMRGNYSNAWRFCVGNNGVYAKDDMTSGAIYGIQLNKLEGENDYFGVAPAVGMSGDPYSYQPPVILYDTTNRRFVQMAANLQSMRMPTAPETYFPYRTGKRFVYMTGTLHDGGEVFTILKDDAGKCWLYGLKVGNFAALSQVKDHYLQIDAPDIEKATAFAVHPILYYLFYAVGDQIYQYDITSGRSRVLSVTLADGKVVERLSGETISMLKFNIFIMGTYSKPAGSVDMQYRLIAGSEETSGADGLGGRVRMLNIPTTLDAPATIHREYSGFGKVRDVVYRERN